MNKLENLLLNSGMSWTYSKAIPYILMILIGLLLVRFIRSKITNLRKPLKWFIKILIFVIPFGIYFLFFPIYEGDFSNSSDQVNSSEYLELKEKKFVVLTIPNCPYCYEAIGRMKALKKRVPTIEIEYIVCTTDSTNAPSYMEWYSNESEGQFSVRIAKDAKAMSELADYSYPTFVLVNEGAPLKKWSNDNFGVVAMDEVEGLLK